MLTYIHWKIFQPRFHILTYYREEAYSERVVSPMMWGCCYFYSRIILHSALQYALRRPCLKQTRMSVWFVSYYLHLSFFCFSFSETLYHAKCNAQVQCQYLTEQIERSNRDFQVPVVIGVSMHDSPSSLAYNILRSGRVPLLAQGKTIRLRAFH